MKVEDNKMFVPWTDPESGVTSYILDERVAPVQKVFYFTNPCFSPDGRYLWFQAAWPPGPQHFLAVADLQQGTARPFRWAQLGSRPLVDDERQGCYATVGPRIYFQPADGGPPEQVFELAPDIVQDRPVHQMCTHVSKSCDGDRIALTGKVGLRWFLGYADLSSGDTHVLHWFDRNVNHEQYSPTDPHLILFAHDWWRDDESGEYRWIDNRMWLQRDTGGRPRALIPDETWGEDNCAHHEWWGPQGRWVYYCDNRYDADGKMLATAVRRVNAETLEREDIWLDPVCHAHCDATARQFVGDFYPYRWREGIEAQVQYFDRESETKVPICSGMPILTDIDHHFPEDPHPRFSDDGRYVVYTTTVRGQVDVAVTPVEDIRSRL